VALYCDVVFASEKAKFADPHVKMGLSAGDGGAIIWPQLIGYARAREFLMTGEFIPAPRAAALGLINYSLPLEELDAAVDAFAKKLSKGALKAISATKRTVNLGLKQIASAVMDASIAYEHQTVYTRDHAEAVNAFLEKRDPVFTGK
jgi:enoyl-CoA hydratase